jgi:hypothetical protein
MTLMPKQSENLGLEISDPIYRLATSIYEKHNSKVLAGSGKWMPTNVAVDLAKKMLSETNASRSNTR